MELRQYKDYFETRRNGSFVTLGNLGSSPTESSLCFVESLSFLSKACKQDIISCVICTPNLAANKELIDSGKGIAINDRPRRAFYQLHNWLVENEKGYCNDYDDTVIGNNSYIHKSAIIAEKGVIIGDNVIIEEQVVIKPGTIIEDNVIIYAGAIIGGENHIITKDQDENLFLIKQVGKCHIGKGVAIGYHSMIAKGTFPYDMTYIGDYTKIENDVEISHNSKIGKNCIVTGQCQVCGTTYVGDNTRLSPQSVISNQTKIGDNVVVEIGSVVVNNVKDNMKVAGNFAIDHMKFLLWHRKKLSGK